MYKTQVFVNHEGDHFRTRLTHTLEVAQLARGICKSLALNEDLAEAIAYGHDLGHTPFGHAVERYLDTVMQKENILINGKPARFYHNEQSVRVVDLLESRNTEYKGLNLTYEVREGILKHNKDSSGIYNKLKPNKPCSSLEGQIVGLVDTVAYLCHDLQDGIQSGLIEDAEHTNRDFREGMKEVKDIIANILKVNTNKIDFTRYSDTYFIDDLIHSLIMNITVKSVENLIRNGIKTQEDIKAAADRGETIIAFHDFESKAFDRLRKLIYNNVYGLHTIETMDRKAESVVKELFERFRDNEKLLPPDILDKYLHLNLVPGYDGLPLSKEQVIIDYISCMTDRFALEEYERLRNPHIKI
ncbi:deoxyguanosinetriphosphate triphosphohydrolase-like protein [Anaerocolumna cellulosilytica]|uniref:Deoxyguanosinetriphosphate triphosphohydrolase-like protein n=2 Tax=Anaerocolumna cellulosilytica TaxID=433286 RepID=A0A6S6R7M6_9FIRM|nr:HD domain-containing protein [Anaerocolumna cellulosilytica]MBB5197149.1 dGTPase [Anaerocolumna cellulosilytica]BCJ95362.1 deoxyguanosinetriphosphate triphosphohydrolase-like protein [Anaerocolumna cellulosilytica]